MKEYQRKGTPSGMMHSQRPSNSQKVDFYFILDKPTERILLYNKQMPAEICKASQRDSYLRYLFSGATVTLVTVKKLGNVQKCGSDHAAGMFGDGRNVTAKV